VGDAPDCDSSFVPLQRRRAKEPQSIVISLDGPKAVCELECSPSGRTRVHLQWRRAADGLCTWWSRRNACAWKPCYGGLPNASSFMSQDAQGVGSNGRTVDYGCLSPQQNPPPRIITTPLLTVSGVLNLRTFAAEYGPARRGSLARREMMRGALRAKRCTADSDGQGYACARNAGALLARLPSPSCKSTGLLFARSPACQHCTHHRLSSRRPSDLSTAPLEPIVALTHLRRPEASVRSFPRHSLILGVLASLHQPTLHT
jgi:hypothetical protein